MTGENPFGMALISTDGRRVVRLLGRIDGCCALLAKLCRRTGWPEERTLEAVAALHADDWVAIGQTPPVVKLTAWARVWVARDRPQIAVELHPNMDVFAVARLFPYPDEADHVLLGGAGTERERHKTGCGCAICKVAVSATQPPPDGPCAVCRGNGPGAGWHCLGCQRRDHEAVAPPLPYVRPHQQPAKGEIEVNTKRQRRRRKGA